MACFFGGRGESLMPLGDEGSDTRSEGEGTARECCRAGCSIKCPGRYIGGLSHKEATKIKAWLVAALVTWCQTKATKRGVSLLDFSCRGTCLKLLTRHMCWHRTKRKEKKDERKSKRAKEKRKKEYATGR